MGFKLGKNRGNYAVGGEIKTKMRFGKQSGGEGSIPGTTVIRVPLEEGVMGEANMNGSIYENIEEPGFEVSIHLADLPSGMHFISIKHKQLEQVTLEMVLTGQ